MDADAVEIRVLGCLIEKQRTTPDAYPLSLNALRLACNQPTNRDPVVEYDEPTIRDALQRLSSRGWVRLASGPGSRAVKYRHLFDEALGVSGAEISLLAVLMLRGPQTIGELKTRTERLHRFEGEGVVEYTTFRHEERATRVRVWVEADLERIGWSVAHVTYEVTALSERGVRLLEDFSELLRRLVPHDSYYAHDDWDRRTENICPEDMDKGNGHSHCMAMLLGGAGESVPVRNGELQLGVWQRVLFIELDRERDRRWIVQVVGH